MRYYFWLVSLLVVIWGCQLRAPDTSPPSSKPPDKNPAELLHDTYTDPVLQSLLQMHQRHRERPLRGHIYLDEAAQRHAAWMAANNIMSHTGRGGSSFWDRILAAGYKGKGGGENIAAGYATAQSVFQGWLGSPGHRRNIENPTWTHIGLAVARSNNRYFWCAVFATGGPTYSAAAQDGPSLLILPEPLEGDEVAGVDFGAKP